jgi:hypothetical protein
LKQIYIAICSPKNYIYLMENVADYVDNPPKKAIGRRLEILKFFDEFGLEVTKKAFKASCSTVFLCKKKRQDAGGKLPVLILDNRVPLHRRKRIVDPFIVQFIIDYHSMYSRADKTTLIPALTITNMLLTSNLFTNVIEYKAN